MRSRAAGSEPAASVSAHVSAGERDAVEGDAVERGAVERGAVERGAVERDAGARDGVERGVWCRASQPARRSTAYQPGRRMQAALRRMSSERVARAGREAGAST